MTVHKMDSEVGGAGKQKINWGGKEKQPGGGKSWLGQGTGQCREGVGEFLSLS